MKGRKWDGVKRLDTWLPYYMSTKDDEYTRAVGRKWLISAVARAMEPGCQADHMLIFEGRQGVGKSRAARAIGGQFYTEFSGTVHGHTAIKDLVATISGKIVVEMSELATMRRAEIESLKAILTTTVDDVRLSYERDVRAYPRTCVFIGTTNEVGGSYIADHTGARRFWPVTVGMTGPVRIVQFESDVEQLWAEAVEAYEDGEHWHDVPQTLAALEQADRQVTIEDSEPWYPRIRNALTDPDSFAEVFSVLPEYAAGEKTGGFIVRAGTISTILGIVIGVEPARQSGADVLRVRRVLETIGFKKTRPSKPWQGSTWAYDLRRESQPHLWPAITAAKNAIKFPKYESEES
jgi:predicted P-loop ATPase